jgi:hypothetical protein
MEEAQENNGVDEDDVEDEVDIDDGFEDIGRRGHVRAQFCF